VIAYGVDSPTFDDPQRGDAAWQSFLLSSIVLCALGTAAAWAVWLTWRRRAHVDLQPDGAARLLAIAVATLPPDRRQWGTAMTAELASLSGRADRWRFAVSGTRAALLTPAGAPRPAAGWASGAVGALGVAACVVTTLQLFAENDGAGPPAYTFVVLVVVLAACLLTIVAAPPALTSNPLARRTGLWLGLTTSLALLLWSRTFGDDAGAIGMIGQLQALTFVAAPAIVAAATRSLRAGLQCTLWGFVFTAVTMLPVYIVESIHRYRTIGGLYLDGDTPRGSTIASNLSNAVTWMLLVVPGTLIPVGVVIAAGVAAAAHTGPPPDSASDVPLAPSRRA
jgi:hypothetical protein